MLWLEPFLITCYCAAKRCRVPATAFQTYCPLAPLPSPQGKIKREAVDQRMVRALADMPAELAEEAVSRYARSVDEHVRNPQGFMVRQQ